MLKKGKFKGNRVIKILKENVKKKIMSKMWVEKWKQGF